MSKLFAELYVDEDVSVLIAELLRSHGFAAVAAKEVGRRGMTDAEQLDYATEHSMVLLTHNRRDFEALAQEYFRGGRQHTGIIIAVRRSPYVIINRLLVTLNQLTADEMQNKVLYI